MKEFTLVLTSDGPKIWCGGGANSANRYLDEARAFIKYFNGSFVYEAAIPWSVFGAAFNDVLSKKEMLYGIAINDNDAIDGRKFLERFEGSIVYGKRVESFAKVKLAGEAPAKPVDANEGVGSTVFFDDFKSYPDGTFPTGYESVFNGISRDAISIWSENNWKGLRLRASKELRSPSATTPYALLLSRLLLEPGAQYVLKAKLKGCVSKDAINTTLGICSDRWGNQDFRYVNLKEGMKDWTEVSLNFDAPMTGELRLIIRDKAEACDLVFDEIRIARKK